MVEPKGVSDRLEGFVRENRHFSYLVGATARIAFIPLRGKRNFGWKIRSSVLAMLCLKSLLNFLVEILCRQLHRSGTLKRRLGRISQF